MSGASFFQTHKSQINNLKVYAKQAAQVCTSQYVRIPLEFIGLYFPLDIAVDIAVAINAGLILHNSHELNELQKNKKPTLDHTKQKIALKYDIMVNSTNTGMLVTFASLAPSCLLSVCIYAILRFLVHTAGEHYKAEDMSKAYKP